MKYRNIVRRLNLCPISISYLNFLSFFQESLIGFDTRSNFLCLSFLWMILSLKLLTLIYRVELRENKINQNVVQSFTKNGSKSRNDKTKKETSCIRT